LGLAVLSQQSPHLQHIQKLRATVEQKRPQGDFVGELARKKMLELRQQLDQKEARARTETKIHFRKKPKRAVFGLQTRS
jgi:hypothetical protein